MDDLNNRGVGTQYGDYWKVEAVREWPDFFLFNLALGTGLLTPPPLLRIDKKTGVVERVRPDQIWPEFGPK